MCFDIKFQLQLILIFECIMIGDDIVGDVKGAQNAGFRALQVRTGKYRFDLFV